MKLIYVILIILSNFVRASAFEYTPDRVWGSYSDRTAKIQPNDRDYEILTGIQNKDYIIDTGIEKESGSFYRLAKINVRPLRWLEGEYLLKEAYNINSQSLRGLYQPFKALDPFPCNLLDKLSIGASLNYVKWSNSRVLMNLGWRSKNCQLTWESNFKDRLVMSYKVGFDIPHGKKVVTQWFRKYEKNNGSSFDQNKLVIGYKINE